MTTPLVYSTLFAVLLAQAIKFVRESIQHRQILWSRFFEPGGMPSSHTALVVSLFTGVALRQGIYSDLFAATAAIGAVVIFDAMGIRRSAGEHARTINWILVFLRIRRGEDVPLKERLGHSPPEVLAGAVLGFLVAWAAGM
ncbi:divergent PAP2 family protein [Heliobacterium undosum]|uniref:Divergent PAP2 family protein n=1 Tax=Heliomicrobium undosum TaxID=121734 RepID=A0A845KZW0_9FIRM|nr:divergent PAP2 family protein [Heliomicrobium undosum]MZP29393.1 divergent PAP2 family protein [Heliomicrobium undosum]